MRLIKVLLLIALFVFSAIAQADTQTPQRDEIHSADLIRQCWQDRDHAGMSACIKAKHSETRTALHAAEAETRHAITRDREDARRKAVAIFEADVISFRKYRHDHCALIYTLASTGNGAEDNRKACEAELDAERTVQLQNAAQWLAN